MKLIIDLIYQLSRSDNEDKTTRAERRYALNLLEKYMDRYSLDSWNGLDALKDMTEKELLHKANDWKDYSYDGWALTYSEDIIKTLFGKQDDYQQIADMYTRRKLMDLQAKALEKGAELLLRTYTEMAVKPEITKMLTLSTKHLTMQDVAFLIQEDKDPGSTCLNGLVVYKKDAYGYLVYLPEATDPYIKNWTKSVTDAVRLAEQLECGMICFDRDAQPLPEPTLKQYPWS